MATQVRNGKAFEYALLLELYDKLKEITSVVIVENDPFFTA